MISVKNLRKSYGDKVVYDGFSIDIESGKITVILGESGSGKTTLISVLAGITSYSGTVEGITYPVSVVFQRDRLVPHLTVYENVSLVNPAADVKAALDRAGLFGAEDKYPSQLSAGMARRAAIARAFAAESELVLMDEPIVNLDIGLKYALTGEIKALAKKDGKTVIVVTHDVKEAVDLADRIVVISRGKIVHDEKTVTERSTETLTEILLKIYSENPAEKAD